MLQEMSFEKSDHKFSFMQADKSDWEFFAKWNGDKDRDKCVFVCACIYVRIHLCIMYVSL